MDPLQFTVDRIPYLKPHVTNSQWRKNTRPSLFLFAGRVSGVFCMKLNQENLNYHKNKFHSKSSQGDLIIPSSNDWVYFYHFQNSLILPSLSWLMQKTQAILSIFPKFCLGCSCGVLWVKLDCHYGFLNFVEIFTNTSTSQRCTRPAILIWEKSQPKQGRRERRRKFRFCYCKVTQPRNNCGTVESIFNDSRTV